ncbi:DUF2306 domain-containing protein [Nocardiopsis sp. N85]|uniref:DUF2306 domain-containing protein n=1 Tax=Nocardiopsis sp. N85 TaxID=3029400 RepID=UPI00237F981F|nr:DUF2306 domain-containing protein [Nocardiopsis sp. N85]MDE3723628.1 DUF2306 domain-containing protein [Nocardiopsis sp. N85]
MAPPVSTDTAEPRPRPRPPLEPVRWWRRPWIAPLALFSVTFLLYSVPPYASLDPADARLPIPETPAWYFPVMLVHIFGGTLLTVLVILQVWPWLRSRHPVVHRWSGRIYVLAGIPLVGVPALLIAPFSSTGLGTQVSNTLWAVLWSTFTLLGYVMARRRRFADHREWMLRSFALIYGIAFNRVVILLLLPLAILQARTGAIPNTEAAITLAIAPASSFLSWVVPLLFVEWWIKYRGPRGRRRPAPS